MKLRLTVDGKIYEVDVEIIQPDRPHRGQMSPAAHPPSPAAHPPAATPVAAAPSAATPASPASVGPVDETKVFRSPISGVVVRVPVEIGQTVKANDVLMVLEAMKMETVITAQADGKISKINAGVGDSVQVKQVLVEFE